MTAKSKTDVSGSGSLADIAGAAAGAAVGAAQTSASQDSATSYQRDSARVSDFDKDTGTDERYEVESADRSSMTWLNAKRTYDWAQTLDSDALIDKRKHQAKMDSLEIAEREQRISHANALREQSLRHYEDMHSLRYFSAFGFAADTVQEAFAEKVADKVWTKCQGDMPK